MAGFDVAPTTKHKASALSSRHYKSYNPQLRIPPLVTNLGHLLSISYPVSPISLAKLTIPSSKWARKLRIVANWFAGKQTRLNCWQAKVTFQFNFCEFPWEREATMFTCDEQFAYLNQKQPLICVILQAHGPTGASNGCWMGIGTCKSFILTTFHDAFKLAEAITRSMGESQKRRRTLTYNYIFNGTALYKVEFL